MCFYFNNTPFTTLSPWNVNSRLDKGTKYDKHSVVYQSLYNIYQTIIGHYLQFMILIEKMNILHTFKICLKYFLSISVGISRFSSFPPSSQVCIKGQRKIRELNECHFGAWIPLASLDFSLHFSEAPYVAI